MESNGMSSGGGQAAGRGGGQAVDGSEVVTLEAFITSNWEILTIFGVFAGFTNYMSGVESEWLVTLGFFMTFVVELEILQLLLRIKNGSFLLRVFTLLSGVFIVVFGGFLYSKHLAGILSGFGVAIHPLVDKYRVYILRAVFFASAMIVLLGLYKYLRSIIRAVLKLVGGSTEMPSVKLFSTALVLAVALVLVLGFILAPPGAGPAERSITTSTLLACKEPLAIVQGECCMDFDKNGVCDKDEGASTTLTKPQDIPNAAAINGTENAAFNASDAVCLMNSDCGNQTQIRICYQGDVYFQQQTPLCQKPGTPEARCVTKTILVGETLTQSAMPFERCNSGCKDGECVTRSQNSSL
jgi:hypothetical protein